MSNDEFIAQIEIIFEISCVIILLIALVTTLVFSIMSKSKDSPESPDSISTHSKILVKMTESDFKEWLEAYEDYVRNKVKELKEIGMPPENVEIVSKAYRRAQFSIDTNGYMKVNMRTFVYVMRDRIDKDPEYFTHFIPVKR